MTDLFTPSEEKENKIPEMSVSEISFAVKRIIEGTFNKVRVKGEIFGAQRANSGHIYMSLKDDNAVLSAVCWKGVANRLITKPEDGIEVICTGKLTTFPGRSNYQLVIEQIEMAGVGALLKLLEERKKQFAAEGLFDESRKKKIPLLPNTIGVVTSPTGAVIRDIKHRLEERFPRPVLLWPTPVQGEGAAKKIAEAISGLNSIPKEGYKNSKGQFIQRPDVIIVARGGGSLEDLWAFNEEVVVRAVAESDIPIISAVGHETDTMLIDYVSDLRAPTPTGAAEKAVPVRREILAILSQSQTRLITSSNRMITEKKNYIEGLSRGIPKLDQILFDYQQKLDDRISRFEQSYKNYANKKQSDINQISLKPYLIKNIIDNSKNSFENLSIRLDNSSIDKTLKRGFAWVKGDNGETIYNKAQANKQKSLNINFADDSLEIALNGKTKKTIKKKKNNDDLQEDLFK